MYNRAKNSDTATLSPSEVLLKTRTCTGLENPSLTPHTRSGDWSSGRATPSPHLNFYRGTIESCYEPGLEARPLGSRDAVPSVGEA